MTVTARAQRTRDTVVDALLALLADGEVQPAARQVAERAGVSIRTVFAHFASLEDLYQAAVERSTTMVLQLLSPIDPDQPLADRIDDLCSQRATVNEQIGPIRRAAALKAPSSPTLAGARDNARRASREQLDRVLATELGALDAPERRRRRAVIDAALSGETWDLLRATHRLSPDDAGVAVRVAVSSLLADPAPAAAGAPVVPARTARRVAAERALAALDLRIERLLAAVEAGAPADLVAPRLEELRTDRLAAARDVSAASAAATATAAEAPSGG